MHDCVVLCVGLVYVYMRLQCLCKSIVAVYCDSLYKVIAYRLYVYKSSLCVRRLVFRDNFPSALFTNSIGDPGVVRKPLVDFNSTGVSRMEVYGFMETPPPAYL